MGKELADLITRAKRVHMTEEEKEEQRRSFAYGNAKIENDMITRETIARQAKRLSGTDDK